MPLKRLLVIYGSYKSTVSLIVKSSHKNFYEEKVNTDVVCTNYQCVIIAESLVKHYSSVVSVLFPTKR